MGLYLFMGLWVKYKKTSADLNSMLLCIHLQSGTLEPYLSRREFHHSISIAILAKARLMNHKRHSLFFYGPLYSSGDWVKIESALQWQCPLKFHFIHANILCCYCYSYIRCTKETTNVAGTWAWHSIDLRNWKNFDCRKKFHRLFI